MFDSFISLGFFCGTAASMSGHGLRSFSGPFDWIFYLTAKRISQDPPSETIFDLILIRKKKK